MIEQIKPTAIIGVSTSAKAFDQRASCLVNQYGSYTAVDDIKLNGKLTLGENIADVAGLTGDQQFFLSFAQSWRTKMREPALRQQVLQDGHAPDEYRADTVRNLDPWYAAFAVKPGEALYLDPKDRIRVW